MGLPAFIKQILERQLDMLPNVDGRAYTRTLRVSPNGSGHNGLSWRDAYQTLPDALDAASTNANELTKILLPPGTYDINLPGDPTWAANICIQGSHRNWPIIVNRHTAATSVINLTGGSSISDVTISCGTDSLNGLSMTGAGARLRRVYLECENVTGAQTALEFGDVEYVIMEDVMVHGVVGFTQGMLLTGCHLSNFKDFELYSCLIGLQITGAGADDNHFKNVLLDSCALGMDLDAGNRQHFHNIDFFNCTRNVDDEVGDHDWVEIHGQFGISILPDTILAGTPVATAAGADAWGADTELLAAAGRDNPFRIVGLHHEPSAAGWFQLRLSHDNGATFFDVLQFDATKREGVAAPSGTEHIFNADTRISGSARSDSGNDTIGVWIEIQEI